VSREIAWEYLLDWFAWRYPALRPVLKSPSLVVVNDGRVVPSAMRTS
jgi:uncharacterized membrane protein YcaP (DUF421 family)